MFDPNKGNQAIDTQVETQTDEFAALFMDLSPRKRLQIIQKMNELLADDSALDAFVTGNSQNNGQPQAIGSGNSNGNGGSQSGSQPVSEQDALNVLMQSPVLSGGIKNALRRILNPRDPEVIAVENDGTPSDVAALTAELKRERDRNVAGSLAGKLKKAEDDRDTAKKELAEEKDENKSGSLAKQLKDAQAAAAAATGFDVAKVKAKFAETDQAIDAQSVDRVRGKVVGDDKVKGKLGELWTELGIS